MPARPPARSLARLQKRRDPRFDNLSGAYDPRQFSESYAFLNDARQDEIKRLKSALHATKKRVGAVDLVEREAMHRELGRLQTKQAAYEKQQREKQAVGSWREQEDKKQSDGKKAFYLKAGEFASFPVLSAPGSVPDNGCSADALCTPSPAQGDYRRHAHAGAPEGQAQAAQGDREAETARPEEGLQERSPGASGLISVWTSADCKRCALQNIQSVHCYAVSTA
jgi:uncharacterized protein YbaA (DUF1428 family)